MLQLTPEQYAKLCLPDPGSFCHVWLRKYAATTLLRCPAGTMPNCWRTCRPAIATPSTPSA